MRNSILTLLLMTFTSISYAQSTIILNQPESPLSITSFSASYQEGGRYTSEGVRYDVSFKNISEKRVVAYAFDFFSFDVFNRKLGRPLEGFSVTTITPNSNGNGAWIQRMSSPALFKYYGTAVAYVARVRFEDGAIWSYDADAILSQLQEFESSLTLEDLQAE